MPLPRIDWRSSTARPARLSLLALVFLCAVAPGCGTGEYERRMQVGKQREAQRAAEAGRFNDALYGAGAIGQTPVMIRVAKVFTNSLDANSPDPVTGGPINPQRLKPPFLPDFPGFGNCYEAYHEDPQAALPYYCYLGAVEGDASLADTVLNQLKAAFPGSSPAWTPYDAATPSGETVAWRKVRFAGNQPFFQKNLPMPVNVNGIFELHVHESNGWLVFVGWRMPQSISAAVNWEELAALTDGTVQVPGS
jgi:hypothetical protein